MYGLLWAGEHGIESREQADSPYALVAIFFQSWQCCWRNGMNGQQVEGQHQFDSTRSLSPIPNSSSLFSSARKFWNEYTDLQRSNRP